ncbi:MULTISPECIES: hypothetical protein [Clostridium]|jgi:hypothetical protein|uniref:hypothetical protein n=1 Tax=Clostridium TaxID=1485 RepID=UPI001EEF1544|nr:MULTISPECIES: hypothetical protein [Clostridium]
MFSFKKEDVWIGYSLKDLSKVIRVLLDNNIEYTNNKVSTLRNDESTNLRRYDETQYTITVSKRNAKEAKYLINNVLSKDV